MSPINTKPEFSHELQDLQAASIKKQNQKSFVKTIIKKTQVRLNNPKVIEIPEDTENSETAEEQHFEFKPIIEKNVIKGLGVKCSCGNCSEVYFKYREKTGKPSPADK